MNRFLKRFFGKDCFNVQDNIENLRQKQKPIYELPVDLANPLIVFRSPKQPKLFRNNQI